MNKKLLENRNEFKEFISDKEHVKLVLFGHIHYPMTEVYKGVLYSSAPSIVSRSIVISLPYISGVTSNE